MNRAIHHFFSRFDEVMGHPADYRPHGYISPPPPSATSSI
jgi:hypothetical protein